jgi:hypothetical protein
MRRWITICAIAFVAGAIFRAWAVGWNLDAWWNGP